MVTELIWTGEELGQWRGEMGSNEKLRKAKKWTKN